MNLEQSEIRKILMEALTRIDVKVQDFEQLGERLDSLDRLTLITECENSLGLDLTEILIEPDYWSSFLTLLESINKAYNHETL
jgi:acyl carrier protein